jgi:hypothetical protein
MARLIRPCSIGTSSSMPRRSMRPRDALGAEDAHEFVLERQEEAAASPGRPAPARPRSWLSMRRDSWRSVPRMCRPPAARTSCSRDRTALEAGEAGLEVGPSPSRAASSWPGLPASRVDLGAGDESALPPDDVRCPRPAMLGEIVTAPLRPACATMNASRSCCLAFRRCAGCPSCAAATRRPRTSRR